ncbi:MAG: cellulase family glycosylhydrolase [Anaerolineae bacterium]
MRWKAPAARLIGAAICAACIFFLLFACAPRRTPTPPAAESPTPPAVPAGAVLGIELTSERDEGQVELAAGTGARWVRVPLRWRTIEPRQAVPPAYRFDIYDKLLSALRRRGFQIILTVRDNPTWSADTDCGPLNAAGQEAFLRFLKEAVARYHQPPYEVQHWELYNEPDNTDAETYGAQGGCWGNAPAAYAELLRQAYPVIKGVDPQAVVIFGGLALEQIEGNPFNVHFLEQALDAGAGPHFDWANFHYYPAFSYRWERFGRGIQGKAAYIQGILAKTGAAKPVICSEMGQPTAGPAAEGYSDQKTADEMVRSYARAVWAGMPAAVWHKLQDRSGEARLYGLVDAGGAPKPAYRTFQLLSQHLSRAYFRGEPSVPSAGPLEAYASEYEGEGFTHLVIAWRNGEGPAIPLSIPAPRALIVQSTGEEIEAHEGGSGDTTPSSKGITVQISSHPLILLY